MKKRIAFVDIETTGLEESDEVTEAALAIFAWPEKRLVFSTSFILNCSKNLDPKIQKLTALSDEIIKISGLSKDYLKNIEEMLRPADFIVAHNAKNMEIPWLKKLGLEFDESKWIDSSVDIPFPEEITTRKQIYLASEHGIYVSTAHEALRDVLTLSEIFFKYDLQEILKYRAEPTLEVIAKVSFAEKDLARENGFRWNGEKKQWSKNIKVSELNRQCNDWKFKYEVKEL